MRKAAYDHAVDAAVGHLQRYTTMAALVAASASPDTTPAERDWLVAITHAATGILSMGVVRDAAFWRRAQEMIAGPGNGREA